MTDRVGLGSPRGDEGSNRIPSGGTRLGCPMIDWVFDQRELMTHCSRWESNHVLRLIDK